MGKRCALTADQFLQGQVDVDADIDRVDAYIWRGAVAAFAFDLDFKAEHRGHGFDAGGDDAGGDLRRDVHGEGRFNLWIFQNSLFDTGLTARKDFFSRLEQQLDWSAQLTLAFLEQLGGAQQDSGVQVVAASVHLAGVAGGKGQAGFLLNWQRVHVAAQHEALAFLRAKLCQYARAVDDGGVGDAHLVQLLLYKGAGLRQLQSQFRVLMDGSSPGYQLIFNFICSLQ